MDKKEELLKLVGHDIKTEQLVDEIVFIEDRLNYLKKLPFLNVNLNNPMQQKATPAAKQYKELLQQYNNCLRLLYRITGDLGGDVEEESPLRKWLKSRSEG